MLTVRKSIKSFVITSLGVIGSGAIGALLLTPDAKAATLSFSESTFEFSNFSISPLNTSVQAVTDTLTVSRNGIVQATADAQSIFVTPPLSLASAFNFVSSLTTGEGLDYFGVADSYAGIVGDFNIGSGEVFSFDFTGSIVLNTEIKAPIFEVASSLAGINFNLSTLMDDGTVGTSLDYLDILAFLNTPGLDSYSLEKTDSISLNSLSISQSSGSLAESFVALFSGTFSRFFPQATKVQLSEAKAGLASISASPYAIPEPLTILGSLLAVGIGGLLRKEYYKIQP